MGVCVANQLSVIGEIATLHHDRRISFMRLLSLNNSFIRNSECVKIPKKVTLASANMIDMFDTRQLGNWAALLMRVDYVTFGALEKVKTILFLGDKDLFTV